jgi:hypothetical protein
MKIVESVFMENKGLSEGGALKYTEKKPELINCKYVNNEAPYGPVISSYPVRLSFKVINTEGKVIDISSIENLVTGLNIQLIFNFELLDEENQLVTVPQSENE